MCGPWKITHQHSSDPNVLAANPCRSLRIAGRVVKNRDPLGLATWMAPDGHGDIFASDMGGCTRHDGSHSPFRKTVPGMVISGVEVGKPRILHDRDEDRDYGR